MQLITSCNNWLRGFFLLPDLCGVVLINHIDPLVVLTVFVLMFDSIETSRQDLNIDPDQDPHFSPHLSAFFEQKYYH